MSSSIFVDFLEGCAAALVANGVGVYRASPAYTLAETGIRFFDMPDGPEVPNNMIVLSVWSVGGDDPNLPIGRLALQARTRAADVLTDLGLQGGIYQTFQGLKHVTMGSVHVIQMRNTSSAFDGTDTHGRPGTFHHFYADVDLPATANRNLAF